MRRPDVFTLDYSHQLAQGLVLAGLGQRDKTRLFYDSSLQRNHGAMDSICTITHSNELGRAIISAPNTTSIPGTIVVPQNLNGWSKASTRHTISFWVRFHTFSEYKSLFMCGPWNNKPAAYVGAPNLFTWFEGNGSDGYDDRMYIPLPELGVWTHMLLSWNGDSVQHSGWKNGIKVASRSLGSGSKQAVQTPLYILSRSGSITHADIADFIWWADRDLGNSGHGSAEIAILADRTDPMLGGLIVEDRPVLWFPLSPGGTPYAIYQDMYARISWDQTTLQDAVSKISTLHDLTQDAASAISSSVATAQDATSAISSAVATTQDARASISLVYSLTQDAFTAVSEDYVVLHDAQATISEQVGYVVHQDALAQIHETYAKVQDASAGISSEIIVVQDARAVISEGVVYSVTQDAIAQISTVLLVRQDAVSKIATTVQEIHDAVAGVSSGYLVIQDGKAVIIDVDYTTMAKIVLPSQGVTHLSLPSSGELRIALTSRNLVTIVKLGG